MITGPTHIQFQGINISKPVSQTDKKKSSLRREQAYMIKDWESKVENFSDTFEKKEEGPLNWYDFLLYNFPLALLFTRKANYEHLRSEFDKTLEKSQKAGEQIRQIEEIGRSCVDEVISYDRKQFENLTPADIAILVSSKKGGSEIAGYKNEVETLDNVFIKEVIAEKYGADNDVFGSVLFFGPYGNGKTHITKSIAEATNSKIVKIVTPNDSDESKRKTMDKIYSVAKKSEARFNEDRTRTIIFLDEAEKIIGKGSPVADEFSEFIKDCSKKHHCTVFAATNFPLDLDVDMEDADIFPIKMSIDPPNEENATAMFQMYLKDDVDGSVDYQEVVKAMTTKADEVGGKFSNAQIRNICISSISHADEFDSIQDGIIAQINSREPEITPTLCEKFDNDYKQLIEKRWEE